MHLAHANQSQLIRSSQKDEHYQSLLRNNVNDAFQTLAGSRRWLDWRKELELLSDLIYFGLTTFSGYQTLGEEYVNVVQVDPTQRRIPSRVRRGVLVLCHSFGPYLLDKVLVCLENELDAVGEENQGGSSRRRAAPRWWNLSWWLKIWMRRVVGLLSEPQRRACLPGVFTLQQSLTLLHRVHVALFYVSGEFYHLAKRMAGIRYLRVMGRSGDERSIRTSYRLLGAVSLLQLIITVALHINNSRQRQRARQEWKLYRNLSPSPQQVDTSSPRASRCILCLEERRNSTSTPCGHLFCWECITEWCNTKTECPLCRDKFQPHRLVYLRNYS
ncbi:peroxisome biogenesis factor 10-like [Diretmus argenteus]